jgi:hypothetical protein
MTHRYITFASFGADWPLVNELYSDAAGARVTLRALKSNADARPHSKLWIDAEVDGLHCPEVFSASRTDFRKYRAYIEQFPNATAVVDDKPDAGRVSEFVDAVLNSIVKSAANAPNLGYISVPQLPYTVGTGRNKINRMLAEAALRWKSAQRRPPKFILPVIFATTRGQTDLKTHRTAKVKVAISCFEASGADGIWVVDSTLDDHDAAGTHENRRFPGIINFHEELNKELPSDAVTVAGPYWALNLALWARGLVRFPVVGMGRSFQYFVPGRDPQSANTRVAIPPLKRLVVFSALRPWLQQTLHELPRTDPVRAEFEELSRKSDSLQDKKHARRQIAIFYRDWLEKLEAAPNSGRALTLYQDLSAAFVLGSRLKPFDKNLEKVPNPAIIAKQLMVNCL